MNSALSKFAPGFLAISLVSAPVHATTANASLGVSATVLSSCAASVSPARYGTASVAAAEVAVKCTYPTQYNVDVSAGGASRAGTAGVTGTGNGSVYAPSIVGQIPGGQRLEGVPDSNAVVVTVTY